MLETKTVKGVPTSFVANNMKLISDRGSGEAKLWVGQVTNEREFDDFFAFNSDYNYCFLRENLIEYLTQFKIEYIFQKFNNYKNASIESWNDNMNTIKLLPDSDFYFNLSKFADATRYYIRSEDRIFSKIFRSITIPRLTNAVFVKNTDLKLITLSLEINLEYNIVSSIASFDLKSEFEKYIKNILGLKSIRQVADLDNLSNILLNAGVLSKSVYSISDIDEYINIVKDIKNSKVYQENKASKKEISPKSGLAYDQGMTNYGKFLRYYNFEKQVDELIYYAPSENNFSRNRIIFGAPGTGKSFMLNDDSKLMLGEDNEAYYERVTFHPDYSYANFVGTYKPVMVNNSDGVIFNEKRKKMLSVLLDKTLSNQNKHDLLHEELKVNEFSAIDLLIGLYSSDESLKAYNFENSTDMCESNVGWRQAKELREYVNLLSNDDFKNEISYEYVPGPFMRVYVNALKSARSENPRPYLLIIEEINRAHVAAVFGDVFQLLDRDVNGVSEYPIQASEDIKKYLAKELGGSKDDYYKIRIPSNMFIWATMNSADQGVFPMDTAFKRRWDFTYLDINNNDEDIRGKYVFLGTKNNQKVEWNKLRKAINNFLAKLKINEDKQLGPYFISRNIVIPKEGNEINREVFVNTFKNKVLMYLFEDAAKQKRTTLFEGCINMRYSEICIDFEEKGIEIFHQEIVREVDSVIFDVKSTSDIDGEIT